MRRLLTSIVAAAGLAFMGALAAQGDKPHSDKERKEDVARHRAMAAAHESAAKCLESGKSEKDCQGQLAKDCKGLGIGKYCGMKHKH